MPTVKPENPKVFQNLKKAYRTGFEASFEINIFKDYFFKSEMAYVYAKNKDLEGIFTVNAPF